MSALAPSPPAAFLGFHSREWTLGINCCIASLLSLSFALWLNLPNPAWATLTVYLCSAPFAAAPGSVAARALYRMVGTLLGVVAGLAIIPNLVNSPPLMIVGLTLWLAVGIYLGVIDRTYRNYAFLVAAFTPCLAGLAQVLEPMDLFDSSVVRAEEIFIGAGFAFLVHSLIAPHSTRSILLSKVDAIQTSCEGWIRASLTGAPLSAADQQFRRKLAGDLTDVHLLSRLLPFELGFSWRTVRIFRALESQLAELLPAATALEAALEQLRKVEPELLAVRPALKAASAWLDGPGDTRPAAVIEECRRLSQSQAADLWPDLLVSTVAVRLAQLVEGFDSVRRLSAAIALQPSAVGTDVMRLAKARRNRTLHIDHGLAGFYGVCAALAVGTSATFVIATDWAGGYLMVGLTAGPSAVLSPIDDATALFKVFIYMTLASIATAAVYMFALLSMVDSYWTLMLVTAPLFLVTGLYLGNAKYGLHAVAYAIVSQTLLGIQSEFHQDFVAFADTSLAALGGLSVALLFVRLVRAIPVATATRRILKRGWDELADIRSSSKRMRRSSWLSRMLDRQALLLTRQPRLPKDHPLANCDVLNDLRVGLDIDDLRTSTKDAAPLVKQAVADAVDSLPTPQEAPTPERLAFIDAGMTRVASMSPGESRSTAIAALVDLRACLFPQSMGYVPKPVTQ